MFSQLAMSLKRIADKGKQPVSANERLLSKYTKLVSAKLFSDILKRGPVPTHMAFITDGNLRFFKQLELDTVTDGHRSGERNMFIVIIMALELGIRELSLFSFSEDNFNRPQEEAQEFMDMTKERMANIFGLREEFKDTGVRLDVVGDWELIPRNGLTGMFGEMSVCTKEGRSLHVHFAYSSYSEIFKEASDIVDGLNSLHIREHDVNKELLQDLLGNYKCNPVDILVRTGGNYRISDFLLLQASSAFLKFVDCPWPQYKVMDFLKTIMEYQEHLLEQTKHQFGRSCLVPQITNHLVQHCNIAEERHNKRQTNFLRATMNRRWECIEKYAAECHV